MKNLTLFIFITLLTACGASNNSDSAQLPTELQDLEGSWQEQCEIDTDDNDSSKGIEKYSGAGIKYTEMSYTDSDCAIERLSIIFTASINYAGEKIINSGQTVKKVGMIIDTDNVLVLLIDETLQTKYIDRNICARTDWNSEKYINISDCYEFKDLIEGLKAPLKSIYYIDGNDAYWGDSDRQSDENGFPSELYTIPNTKI